MQIDLSRTAPWIWFGEYKRVSNQQKPIVPNGSPVPLFFFVAVSRGMGNQMWFVLSNGNFNGILEVQFSRFRVDRVFVKVTFLRHRKTKGSWSWGSIGPREWSLSYCIHYRLLVLLQKKDNTWSSLTSWFFKRMEENHSLDASSFKHSVPNRNGLNRTGTNHW